MGTREKKIIGEIDLATGWRASAFQDFVQRSKKRLLKPTSKATSHRTPRANISYDIPPVVQWSKVIDPKKGAVDIMKTAAFTRLRFLVNLYLPSKFLETILFFIG